MPSVARRPQTGALPVDKTGNEEMKKGVLAIQPGKGFSQTHAFPVLLAPVRSCHNMITAVKMVSDLHQGTGASGLLFGAFQGLGRREGRHCAHSALDAKVVAMLEGGEDAGHLHVGWMHSTRMAATSRDHGS